MRQEAVDLTTDEEIDAALERAKSLPDRPKAISANYNRELDLILIGMDNGHRLVIPREELQGLETGTETQWSDIEIFAGVNIGWRQLDVDHYLPHLIEGRYASDRWRKARRQTTGAAA